MLRRARRKQAVVVDAVQLLPETYNATMVLAARSRTCGLGPVYGDDGQWQVPVIRDAGVQIGWRGDWLILDERGDLVVLSPTDFAAQYDMQGGD